MTTGSFHLDSAGSPGSAETKEKRQAVWSSGDFGRLAVRLQIVGETLCEAADIHAGEKVLDVAAGSGNASLAAARRFADVTSTDPVSALLEQGRARAEVERLKVVFQQADFDNLPFRGESFDAVLSAFGMMFAPDPERAAGELIRVVKPGGRIGLASWTQEGFIGQLLRTIGAFVPPPASLKSMLTWGTEARVAQLFGPSAASIQTDRKRYAFRFHSVEHWIDSFRAYYAPMAGAFPALDATGQEALTVALRKFVNDWNCSSRCGLVVQAEYLESIITL